jgi:hypothetical protein
MFGLRWAARIAMVGSIALGCGDDGSVASSESSGNAGSTTGTSTGTTESATVPDASSTGDTSATTSTSVGTSDTSSTGDTSTSTSTDESGASTTTGVTDCGPLIVEVFYDADGADDMLQWVKIYNPCGEPIDLSTWTIGYGGEDYGPPRVKGLDGTLDPGGCWVVGGPTADASNGQPIYQYADDFAPGLDLAQEAGGGVALFDLPEADVDATSVPIDAVVYGSNNTHGLVDHTGRPVGEPHVGNPGPGGSIQRTSEDIAWIAAEVPLPNECPPF